MKDFFYDGLKAAINRYLQLDPESKNRLNRLHNKTITIELRPLRFIFQCHFDDKHVKVYPGEAFPADAMIRGTPLQFLNIVLNKSERHSAFADVSIEGNAEIAQQVILLFDDMQIDWEEFLAKSIGDVPAYQMGKVARKMRDWFSNTDSAFTNNINEYLHEEKEWFPTREALQDFFDDIDIIRNDVDRLDAKFKILQENLLKLHNEGSQGEDNP